MPTIEELFRAGIATKRLCLKTELVRTRTALYVWDNHVWNHKLRRITFATADFDMCESPPNVLLVGHIDTNPELYTYLERNGKYCDIVLMTRKWLESYPTFLNDVQLKNIIFIEDIRDMYEYVPHLEETSIEEQAFAVASILNRRVLYLPRSPNETETKRFYEKHVGEVVIGADISMVVPDIVLLQQFFKHSAPARHKEFMHCLQKNVTCPYIDKIVMLVEDGTTVELNPKIITVNIHKRLTYGDALRWASKNLCDETVVIVANLDIYFDHTLSYLYDLDLKSKCLALLRHEVRLSHPDEIPRPFGPRPDSQDAWIFQLPLPATAKLDESGWDIELGRPGCDNSIVYEMVQRRFCVANPAFTVKAFHVHETGVRDYNIGNLVLRPAYVLVEPTSLGDLVQGSLPSGTIKTFKNVFAGPDGSVYDFKHKYIGAPPRGIVRAVTAESVIAVESTTDMKNPYVFITTILPRLMQVLQLYPDAECRLPDSPELFSTLLSYIAWPTSTIKTIPYHPRLAVWSPTVYAIPAANPITSDDIIRLQRAFEPLYTEKVNMTDKLIHIACACEDEYFKMLCNSGDKLKTAWGGIKTIKPMEKTTEHVKLVRNSQIVIISSEHPAAECIIFAKPGTRIVEIGDSKHAYLAELLGLYYASIDEKTNLVDFISTWT